LQELLDGDSALFLTFPVHGILKVEMPKAFPLGSIPHTTLNSSAIVEKQSRAVVFLPTFYLLLIFSRIVLALLVV